MATPAHASEADPHYADWKAPADDGATLLWPDADQLLRDTLDNASRLRSANATLVQNTPLPELRRRLRAWIGHADESRPLFATGHQTELYHPGVWAKNALINAAAGRLGGAAFHFAVDTDAPKHLSLRWPGGSEPLTDDPAANSAAWSGLLAPPTPAHLKRVSEHFAAAASLWGFRPIAFDLLDSMRRLSLESVNLPTTVTNSLHQLDWSLGLRHHALLVSPLCNSEPYLAFAHHILSRADAFAADYNAALADYRHRYRIKSPGRPMPDLKTTPDSCEVPFWLDRVAEGSRTRAAVTRSTHGWLLRAPGGDDFALRADADAWQAAEDLNGWLRRHDLRVSPRALTLTMMLRLLLADQFAHGIGGGRYDQVADRLIARHFGLEPPRFCVTTATLYFPQAVGRTPRACLPCVRHAGHRLRHDLLGDEKHQLVHAIAALPRRSPDRSALFQEMHGRLETAAASHPALRAWQQELAEAERQGQEDRSLFDRELFYAVQPADRLQQIIARYRKSFPA